MSGPAKQSVIGLEVHVQLATRTKLFCADPAEFGAEPNTHVCPVCLGLPGALPVLNRAALDLATRAAVGLGCDVHAVSVFARKNYFYPDLPKGYQITQFERPLATGGSLDVADETGTLRRVRIRRIHVEEDAGKSLHDRVPGCTVVDLNRAGTPLIEIVTEPDIVSPAHARAFLTRLKQTLEYLEVSDCDMEKGSLRVDANVSVHDAGEPLGTKTELKNMNSFSNVERALDREIGRQTDILAAGGGVVHETLLWDAGRGEVRPMRSKEESHDYRYFPEPDLPPVALDPAAIDDARSTLPELPVDRATRFQQQYGLPEYDAGVLTATRAVADYYEAVAADCSDPKAASNWVMTDVLGWINERQVALAGFPIDAHRLAGLIRLATDGTLSSSLARRVFARMIETGGAADSIVEEEGLAQITDHAVIERWVDEVIAEFPAEAGRLAQGETKLLAFLMGQVMKRSRGKADPRHATRLLRERTGSG